MKTRYRIVALAVLILGAQWAPSAARRASLNGALIRCWSSSRGWTLPCNTPFPAADQRGQYHIGMDAFREGRYQEAIEPLRAHLRAEPRDDLAGYYLGIAYRKSGHEGEARRAWRGFGAARIFVALGWRYGSAEALQTAIDAGDRDPRTFYKLGELVWADGREGQARAVYAAGIALDAHRDVNTILASARVAEGSGEWTAAVALNDEATGADPGDPRGYLQAADILDRRLNRHAEALSRCERCVERTGSLACYIGAARASGASGNLDAAIHWGISARDRFPTRSEPLMFLASVRASNGRPDEADGDYARAAIVDPANFWIPLLRGDLALSRGRLSEALAYYNDALRLNPQSQAIQVAFGNYYRRTGNLHAAIAAYERALQIAPDTAEASKALSELAVKGDGLR